MSTKVIPFHAGPFSQWHRKAMVIDGVTYSCCEQYMMVEKARLFGDEATLKRILATPSPREQKRLGRQVRGFSDKVWKKQRLAIVTQANLAKFSQHADLRTLLLNTGDAILCEASAMDRIWGVGLKAHDPRIQNPAQWRGLNLLGEALMAVRETLQQ